MNLTARLHKLNANRATLIERCKRKAREHKSVAADQRELVRKTCKVLKLERRLERVNG